MIIIGKILRLIFAPVPRHLYHIKITTCLIWTEIYIFEVFMAAAQDEVDWFRFGAQFWVKCNYTPMHRVLSRYFDEAHFTLIIC